MISNTLKYIIFIIMFAITIYYYISHRNIGCRDKNALNYNSEVNIHDKLKCIYKVKGCMDKNAPNYNMYANTSCKEDCTGCKLKGNCKLCKYQEECTDSCPECKCKPTVYGCTRDWAINYDKKATIEKDCITTDDILKKISVVSGGDCNKCSGRASIRVGDNYPLIGGNYGINVLVLERHPDLNVRYVKSFSTGNYELENKKFVDFMRESVFHRDIVIVTVRGDATGRKRTETFENAGNNTAYIGDRVEGSVTYSNKFEAEKACTENESLCIGINKIKKDEGEPEEYELMSYSSKLGYREGFNAFTRNVLFLDRILTDESKQILQYLGAKNPEIIREGSYILIGSFLNDIYYETYSANADSYFPYFDLKSYGCLNINEDYFERIKLDPGKYKLLSNSGDVDDVDLNRVDVIYRCAQEALRDGYKVFTVSRTNCYVFRVKKEYEDEIDIDNYLKNTQFKSYRTDYAKNGIRTTTGSCGMNYHLMPFGNNYDESIYYINDVSYSGLFSMFYESMMVQTYSANNFNGFRRDLGIGNHQAVSVISLSPRAIDGKLYMQTAALRIPFGFSVTLFRNIYNDEDIEKLNSYKMSDEEQRNAYFNLNLSNYEGVKIDCLNSNGKLLRSIGYRTWENVIKNLKINSNEESVRVYLYTIPAVEKVSELTQPCSRYGVIVPGWYQDNRFDQRNQCAAPKGKKCCDSTYNQGSKKGENVTLDGVFELNGTIEFKDSENIFYPKSIDDKTWLRFISNNPVNGTIRIYGKIEKDPDDPDDTGEINNIEEYEILEDTIKILNNDADYSNLTLITTGKEACTVDFEDFRSAQEVKDWMQGCKDNLDEITSIKWKRQGLGKGFIGSDIEGEKIYYTLNDAQIGCSLRGSECAGINETPENNFLLMAADSTLGVLNGYDSFSRVDNIITKPEDRYGFDLDDIYNVKYYKEIVRLKEADYKNSYGYMEFYDKSNNKTRQIEFSTWNYFWYNISYQAEESQFTVKVVNPEYKVLPRTLTIHGPTKSDKSKSKDTVLFKDYPNLIKDEDNKINFTNDIGFCIISRDELCITFFEEESFGGLSFNLTYGRYNLPDTISFIIQSIKVNIPFCTIRLFMEYNFKEELVKIVHYVEGNIEYSNMSNYLNNENVRIKSIIIEKVALDNLISNSVDYKNYDPNLKYGKLEYPISYKFKNQEVNNLDLVNDIFKDRIKLDDKDKKILLVEESYLLSLVSEIVPKKLVYINSGGGFNYINTILQQNSGANGNLIIDTMKFGYGCIDTFNNSNNLRKIVFYKEKILEKKNVNGEDIFNYYSLSKLSFSKKERSILIKSTNNLNIKNVINQIESSNLLYSFKLKEIYNVLFNSNLENKLVNINLPEIHEDLLTVPLINENNRSILNTDFKIQILDDEGNINRYISFYGQRYIENYDIITSGIDGKSLNKLSTNEIPISKNEKYVNMSHRSETSINDDYQFKNDYKFNFRLDFKKTIRDSISKSLQILSEQIAKSNGYMETRSRMDKAINKYRYINGQIFLFNDMIKKENMTFNVEEMLIHIYNKFNKLDMILPIGDIFTLDSINKVLDYYLNNENCYIKLFNRYSDSVRLVASKNGKFIEKDSDNKFIYLNKFSELPNNIIFKYSYLFDKSDWENSKDNIDINLDESSISIQLENGTDVLMINVDSNDVLLNFNELDNIFGGVNQKVLSNNIKGTKYSKLEFKDVDKNITKKMNFTGEIKNPTTGLKLSEPIILFNMPVKYLEIYNQDQVYRLMNKNSEVMKITIPMGMNGIYKFGDANNPTIVNKVIRESDDEIKLYDKEDNLIQISKERDVHKYIFGVIFENYTGKYMIEYFPKVNKWVIKLHNQYLDVNKIEIYDPNTESKNDIYDNFGNIINNVNGKNSYVIENNLSNMKVINKDKTFKYYFSSQSLGKF